MKTYLLFTLLILTSMFPVFAQEKTDVKEYNRNFFYGNPFSLFNSTFKVSYERQKRGGNSFVVTAGGILSVNSDKTVWGGLGEIQYRINMNKGTNGTRKDTGIFPYFGPYFNYKYSETGTRDYQIYYYSNIDSWTYTAVSTAGGGLILGVRFWFLSNRLSTDLYAGGGIQYSFDANGMYSGINTSIVMPGYSGIVPKAGWQVGISF